MAADSSGINVGLMLSGFKICIYIYIKDQTLPLGSCGSFTWIILKTSLVWFWTLRICIYSYMYIYDLVAAPND